jgi:hypothetical protein
MSGKTAPVRVFLPAFEPDETEAAHIKPRHAGGEPDVTNGILLRSDIHTLFDNWHFSIDPDSMKARFSPDVLSVDKDLLQLEGKQIDFPLANAYQY